MIKGSALLVSFQPHLTLLQPSPAQPSPVQISYIALTGFVSILDGLWSGATGLCLIAAPAIAQLKRVQRAGHAKRLLNVSRTSIWVSV